MKTKLTLSLDHALIERAKRSARARGVSVSELVADYFSSLEPEADKTLLTPLVGSLYGVAKGARADEADYRKFLREKFVG